MVEGAAVRDEGWPNAGAWRPHTGSNVPRNSCPCGEVLDRNVPMLFTHWERRYLNFSRTMPVTEEGLFVPFYANGKPVGTLQKLKLKRSPTS